jgi:hypothetical protein
MKTNLTIDHVLNHFRTNYNNSLFGYTPEIDPMSGGLGWLVLRLIATNGHS